MEENFKKRNEDKDLIKRYESYSENHESIYFSQDEFENILHHFLEAGKNRKALKAANLAIEQYPYVVDFLVLKAQCYSNMQEFDTAITILEKASNLHPGDAEIFLIKGNVYAMKGDHTEALESFERALESSDEKDDIYYSIGLTYQNQAKYHDAIKYYKIALEENLNNENVLYKLAY